MPILTRLKQKMRDSPYAVGMRLAFGATSCDTFETPAGSRQPGAVGFALFLLVIAHLAPPRGSRPLEMTVDFVGWLAGYVHCTRTALSYPDWCGSPAVLNVAPNGNTIGRLRWPNGRLLGAGWSGWSMLSSPDVRRQGLCTKWC